LIPSPSSLLGILASFMRCGSAADMGSTHTPIPSYKPSTPPSHSLSHLLHSSWGAPCFAGHASPLSCQHRGPMSPCPLPATSPSAGGFRRHNGRRGVPAHGVRAGGCQHSAAQNQSTALTPRDVFIQRTKGLKMRQRFQPDGKALHAQPAEVLTGPPAPARRCTPQRAVPPSSCPPCTPLLCSCTSLAFCPSLPPAWAAISPGHLCFLWGCSHGCFRSR